MNQEIRVYRAATLDEALDQAYQDLGPSATVLHTRQIERKSWLPFSRVQSDVEITASRGPAPARAEATARASQATKVKETGVRSSQPVRTNRPRPEDLASPPPLLGVGPSAAQKLQDELQKRSVTRPASSLAAAPPTSHPQRVEPVQPTEIPAPLVESRPMVNALPKTVRRVPPPAPVVPPAPSPAFTQAPRGLGRWKPRGASDMTTVSGTTSSTSHSPPVAETRSPKPAMSTPVSSSKGPHVSTTTSKPLAAFAPSGLTSSAARIEMPAVVPLSGDTSGSSHWSEIDRQLNSVQQVIDGLHAEFPGNSPSGTGHSSSTSLTTWHQFSEETGLPEATARRLLTKLACMATPKELADRKASQALLSSLIEQELLIAETATKTPGRQQVVAIVGPTGVGKTTTLAKLAANARLREHRKVGLITVDTFRIAAVEQLRTYAEIMELPVWVVSSPAEMRRAVEEYAAMDLILIDTAGRSPYDELKNQELKAILAEANASQIHLCLSMASDPQAMRPVAEKFILMGATHLILTKLDEIPRFGTVLTTNLGTGLPLTYLTTGQEVPDHLEPANRTRIARLILGQDPLRITGMFQTSATSQAHRPVIV